MVKCNIQRQPCLALAQWFTIELNHTSLTLPSKLFKQEDQLVEVIESVVQISLIFSLFSQFSIASQLLRELQAVLNTATAPRT